MVAGRRSRALRFLVRSLLRGCCGVGRIAEVWEEVFWLKEVLRASGLLVERRGPGYTALVEGLSVVLARSSRARRLLVQECCGVG